MNHFYLSGLNIHSRKEFHDAISQAMAFPDYYGRNLDALFDLLTEYLEDTTLTITEADQLEENLGTYFRSLCRVFRDAEENNPHFHIVYKNS